MREIKFRAWDFDHKKMWEWQNVRKEHFDAVDDDSWHVMQYTGLKDKDGKEIYEGDILASENDGKDGADVWEKEIMGAVKWDEGNACFFGLPEGEGFDSIYSSKYAYVIGNIYENPELLS